MALRFSPRDHLEKGTKNWFSIYIYIYMWIASFLKRVSAWWQFASGLCSLVEIHLNSVWPYKREEDSCVSRSYKCPNAVSAYDL